MITEILTKGKPKLTPDINQNELPACFINNGTAFYLVCKGNNYHQCEKCGFKKAHISEWN